MNELLTHNRVILCHFDTYSTALLFARFGNTILAPTPLPESASPAQAPLETGLQHAPEAVLPAIIQQYALETGALKLVAPFQAWVETGQESIRIHLAQFTTFEAPRATFEPHGAIFKPISELRGSPAAELNLLRQAFNLIMGGA
ncbi:hypothetical protein [Methyloterricola oryzae]|uniref:hypothetical protein n=1 Tax=Methyloterricola oryzae TaxID=1495050 RepID=UPI00069930DC|nr:hypothetical protein [Methyloterricola oryzae]